MFLFFGVETMPNASSVSQVKFKTDKYRFFIFIMKGLKSLLLNIK